MKGKIIHGCMGRLMCSVTALTNDDLIDTSKRETANGGDASIMGERVC